MPYNRFFCRRGRTTVNVEPLTGRLVTAIVPAWASTTSSSKPPLRLTLAGICATIRSPCGGWPQFSRRSEIVTCHRICHCQMTLRPQSSIRLLAFIACVHHGLALAQVPDWFRSSSGRFVEAMTAPPADGVGLSLRVDDVGEGPLWAEKSPATTTSTPHPSFARAVWQAMKFDRSAADRSWLDRPFSFSKFGGALIADEPVHDRNNPGAGILTGFRLGWDVADRWGFESRLGFARTSLDDPIVPKLSSHENFLLWDSEVLFYPLGDTKWRPFMLFGAGLMDLHFIDRASTRWHQTLFDLPLGLGIKRRLNEHFAVRLDVVDNMTFTRSGSHELTHGITATAGFETRFGGGSSGASSWRRRKWW